jgi:nucleotide-binding universal stress UspA family protein
MLKILIPVDGSEHARHAISAVAKLAQAPAEIEVMLVQVSSSPAIHGETRPSAFAKLDEAAHFKQDQILEDASALARAAGLRVFATEACTGMVAPEIVRMAAVAGVDQIAMGTRGLGSLGSFLLGSVAQRVVHLAGVPVLLVK